MTDNNYISHELFMVDESTLRDIPTVPISGAPSMASFLPSYPTASILFSCIPDSGITALVRSVRPFDQLQILTEELEFPPGYDLAVQFGIPVMLSAKYGRPIRSDVVAIANNAYDKIKSKNAANRGVPLTECDPGLSRRLVPSSIFLL